VTATVTQVETALEELTGIDDVIVTCQKANQCQPKALSGSDATIAVGNCLTRCQNHSIHLLV
jgi:hypothetical protein